MEEVESSFFFLLGNGTILLQCLIAGKDFILGRRRTVRIIRLVDDDLRIDKLDIFPQAEKKKFPVEVTGDLEPVGFLAETKDKIADIIVADFADALIFDFTGDLRYALLDFRKCLDKDAFDSDRVFIVACRHGDGNHGVFPGKVDDRVDGRIVDGFDVSSSILDFGGLESDILDGSPESIDDADVSDGKVVIEDDEQSSDDILNQSLAAKTDDEGDDTDTGKDRCNIDSPKSKDDT